MIPDDFLILTKAGLYCAAGDFYLDPRKPVRQAVVSHAHADHASRGSLNVSATGATLEFMKLRYGKNAGRELHEYAYHEPFRLGEVELCFYPAGHILGSAQVLMTYRGIRYLYTGDFKLQDDATCEAFEFVNADVLITETTFADPSVSHPCPEKEISQISRVQGRNIIIGAYTLGKAQRLAYLLHTHCPEKQVRVHYSILPYNNLYERAGRRLGSWKAYDRREFRHNTGLVYIVPPLTFHSFGQQAGMYRFFASGWSRLQTENTLYISDHADWNDLLKLIGNVQPQQVWTLHGDGTQLKHYFRDRLTIRLLNEPAA